MAKPVPRAETIENLHPIWSGSTPAVRLAVVLAVWALVAVGWFAIAGGDLLASGPAFFAPWLTTLIFVLVLGRLSVLSVRITTDRIEIERPFRRQVVKVQEILEVDAHHSYWAFVAKKDTPAYEIHIRMTGGRSRTLQDVRREAASRFFEIVRQLDRPLTVRGPA